MPLLGLRPVWLGAEVGDACPEQEKERVGQHAAAGCLQDGLAFLPAAESGERLKLHHERAHVLGWLRRVDKIEHGAVVLQTDQPASGGHAVLEFGLAVFQAGDE